MAVEILAARLISQPTSFLRGASIPEDILRAALEAKLPAVALLDRDGVYGVPRFYSSAHENRFAVRPRVGAEITMDDGTVVPLLVTGSASSRSQKNHRGKAAPAEHL